VLPGYARHRIDWRLQRHGALTYAFRSMQLRIATGLDAPAIAELHTASWRHIYRGALSDSYISGDVFSERLAVWARRLNVPAPNQYVVLAEIRRKVLGFACAYCREHREWGSLLDNIHVDQTICRNGIGAQMMLNIGSWCTVSAPQVPLYLWVLDSNIAAQAFYKKLGADDVGSGLWTPPGGGSVPRRRFSWSDPSVLIRSSRRL
jgi:hypothetical protein